MADIVLSKEHENKISKIAKKLAAGSNVEKRGFKSEAHRLAIDVLYALVMDQKPIFRIKVESAKGLRAEVGGVIHVGVDYLRIRYIIDDQTLLVENVTDFPKLTVLTVETENINPKQIRMKVKVKDV